MTVQNLVRSLLPRSLRIRAKRLFYSRFKKRIGWEYLPQGWRAVQHDRDIKGWNVESVRDTYRRNWQNFEDHVNSTRPLGFWYEGGDPRDNQPIPHNIHMSYAYALGRATRGQNRISMLDWGGGLGHYYRLAQVLYPDLTIDYTCKEMELLITEGQRLFPEATFSSSDAVLDHSYDFVLASSSLHYVQHWQELFGRIAKATRGYFYLTRLPVIERAPSFVFVQRPYAVGYETEYVSWCLNRHELLKTAERCGMQLVREFVMGEAPEIELAPEQNEYRGFLFQKVGR